MVDPAEKKRQEEEARKKAAEEEAALKAAEDAKRKVGAIVVGAIVLTAAWAAWMSCVAFPLLSGVGMSGTKL
jgi:hypothetical protein